MYNIPILIDGPNFINRLIELGIKNKFNCMPTYFAWLIRVYESTA